MPLKNIYANAWTYLKNKNSPKGLDQDTYKLLNSLNNHFFSLKKNKFSIEIEKENVLFRI